MEDVGLPTSDIEVKDLNSSSVTSSLNDEDRQYEKLLLERHKHFKLSSTADS